MTRGRAIGGLIAVAAVALVLWVARNTEWAEVTLPLPPQGEAARNSFYAAQRFAEALGARTSRGHIVGSPPAGGVIVLSAWHWNLSPARRRALETWVESGGRLVIDASVIGGKEDIERWAGIGRVFDDPDLFEDDEERDAPRRRAAPCARLREGGGAAADPRAVARLFWLCDFDRNSWLTSRQEPEWTLELDGRLQAVRVPVGRGTVTAINATPFRYRSLFNGDHGRVFVESTRLGRGDEILFLTEEDHPSLLALVWRYGAPAVLLGLLAVALGLWRGAVRMGPRAPEPDPARRSLAEQIRGTGAFALRHGGGEALHAAVVRALTDAARRRLRIHGPLPGHEGLPLLARAAGVDAAALATALQPNVARRPAELRSAIALLEGARRRLLASDAATKGGHEGR